MKNIVLLAITISAIAFFSCKEQVKEKTKIETSKEYPGFAHNVYFYLNDSLTEDQRKEFINVALSELAQIKSIQSVYYGKPAMTERKVVDNAYDIAWITLFADSAAHDEYQNDSLHLAFKKRYSPWIKDIKIYDNFIENKS